jgi:hypothetical protein
MQVSFYHYDPSLAAAAIFAALYGVYFFWTTYLWLKHRAWVCLIMVVASASTLSQTDCKIRHN